MVYKSTAKVAEDAAPTINSPFVNVPSTYEILSVLVEGIHSLTLAVVPELDPVITSLNWNEPIPEIAGGSATVIVGFAV